jgi:hypothetical protein
MTLPTDPDTRPKPLASFVIFNRQTGEILHTHHVSAVPGAVLPTDDEMTRVVLEHAVHVAGCHASEVDCVKVGPEELRPRSSYRVDISIRRLLETSPHEHGKSGDSRIRRL